jgi:hypothetical protein
MAAIIPNLLPVFALVILGAVPGRRGELGKTFTGEAKWQVAACISCVLSLHTSVPAPAVPAIIMLIGVKP